MDCHSSSSAPAQGFDVNTAPPATELAGATAAVTGGGDVNSPVIGGGDRRKRGRPPRNNGVKPPPVKKPREEDEDVCFICFDGGSLVLCDRKGCPKAYHPACIKRDEAFFRSKAKWNCGWHICSVCQKASQYLCYTCTYSLCKACTKNSDYLCVRGNKGFCSTCMKTIMLIENKDQANKEMVQVDFDDKTSWEYLFKVYWVILKEKLSLTLDELVHAKNPWKEPDALYGKPHIAPYGHNVANDGKGIIGKSFDHLELKKPIELLGPSKSDYPTIESQTIAETNNMNILTSTPQSVLTKPVEEIELQNEDCSRTKQASTAEQTSLNGCMEWASQELLDFVAHMKHGDTSAISQFDVQALLLDYIKKNNLRDPRRKSQIICDSRLTNLFGKPRVGHIEMLKLLEYHYLIKEDSGKSAFVPAGIVGTVTGHVETDDSYDIPSSVNKTKNRKTRKNGEVKMTQINLDEYAAIDAHNINFIYLRRDLMENLAEDVKFHDKVIGSVVRIRIPGNDQKQEIYRLVHVVGTCKSSEPYKIRDKTVDVLLEVLNLDKKEALSIDSLSNQDFCEDECRRLRQSIKCGLVKRLTVGEIQKKAMQLRAVKLNDSLEAEILRLNHLRDRASEKGLKKELRECIEKLELLKTPEERQRRLVEIPEVHADPKMNPDYESEGDDGESNGKRKVEYLVPRITRISRRGEKHMSPGSLVKAEGSIMARCSMSEKRELCGTNFLDKLGNQPTVDQPMDRSGSETLVACLSTGNLPPANHSETDKQWHYRDPSGRIQGPFSVMQLRKWNTSGLFPLDMRVWTNHEHNDSVLLTNVLKGLFEKVPQVHLKTSSSQLQGPGVSDSRDSVRQSENASGSRGERGKTGASGHIHNSTNLSNGNSCSVKLQMSSTLPSSSRREVILALPSQERGPENDYNRSVADHVMENSHGSTMCQINDGHLQQADNRNSGQNQGSFTSNRCSVNVDSGSRFASAPKSSDSSQQKGKMDHSDLPSPTPDTSYGDLEALAAEKLLLLSSVIPVCTPDLHDLPSPTPMPSHEPQAGNSAESKQSLQPNRPVQDSDPRWSSDSSPISNCEAQGRNAAENKQSFLSNHPVQESGPRWSSSSSPTSNGEAQGGPAAENRESLPVNHPVQESGPRWSSASSPTSNREAQGGHAAENRQSVPLNHPVQESGPRCSSASSPTSNREAGGHAAENRQSVPLNHPVLESGPRWSSASSSISSREAQGGNTAENNQAVLSNHSVQVSNCEAQGELAAENKQSVLSNQPVQESGPGWSSASSPIPNSEAQGGLTAGNTQPALSNHLVQDSGPRWSCTSNLEIDGAQLREITDEWGRCSPAAKPSTDEWESGLVSVSPLKPAEVVIDHVNTSTSDANQLNHTSPSHPVASFFSEPIEFSTLAEESVSDLLAEVDAMESQNQNGMGSPTSAMRYTQDLLPGFKTECFSPIEELSPAHDPVKSDALSSTSDIQFPCQSTVTDETVGAAQIDAFDPLKRSGGNSSTSSEGETKSTDVFYSQGEAGSNIPAPCTTSQTTGFSIMGRSMGFENMNSGRGAAPGNVNWGGPVQGYVNPGLGGNLGAAWGGSHMNRGPPIAVNPVWDNQRRYAGERSGAPRDWVQGGDSGFGRGRPSWNRQQPYGGGGGGYSRPPPRGQRICKFYGSGRCKKGASCDYLHP